MVTIGYPDISWCHVSCHHIPFRHIMPSLRSQTDSSDLTIHFCRHVRPQNGKVLRRGLSEQSPEHNLPPHKGLQGKSPVSWSRLPKGQSRGHDCASMSGQSRAPTVRCKSPHWASIGIRGQKEARSWGSKESTFPCFTSSQAPGLAQVDR